MRLLGKVLKFLVLGWFLFLAVALWAAACRDVDITSTQYICIVDGDTIHVPGDSTGVRCDEPPVDSTFNRDLP